MVTSEHVVIKGRKVTSLIVNNMQIYAFPSQLYVLVQLYATASVPLLLARTTSQVHAIYYPVEKLIGMRKCQQPCISCNPLTLCNFHILFRPQNFAQTN